MVHTVKNGFLMLPTLLKNLWMMFLYFSDRKRKYLITDNSGVRYIRNLALKNSSQEIHSTGRARLIRSDSSARFSFELGGNSNYTIDCNSKYVLTILQKVGT